VTQAQRKAVSAHRRRLKQNGIVRLEVRVHREDASLVRAVADALSDPERAPEARRFLRERFGASYRAGSLKALLMAAPLDGIDLDRVT